ncbi:hypothetical protein [Desulfovibrio sp. ZJ200]|uniref:hypothetical protein n=1 Tax=Desulfovibrio sp. ZJ200 TaxID=2709792 RepID=UPI0013EDECE4|nr:hypothetical protein [Desulfovibrio sp. ZJ200]
MNEAEIFERISQDLGIDKEVSEPVEYWYCRLAYSAAAVRGLTFLWEQEENQDEKSVSLKHLTCTIEQTLATFRTLFPQVGKVLDSFERQTKEKLSVKICDILRNGGCFYHKEFRAAPAAPSCAFKSGVSFLRGLRPGEVCPISGAGFYRKEMSNKSNRDIFSMFGLRALSSEENLERLEESLREERRHTLEGREFLCLDPSFLRQGYWKNTPDKEILSLMRRKKGDHSYALYRFDGSTFYCRALPEYWNEKKHYVALAAAMLARRGLPPFEVKTVGKLVFVKPGYLLPPAEDAFFRLYSWPDLAPNQRDKGPFAPRIMAGEIYTAFHDIMTHLGYRFKETSHV